MSISCCNDTRRTAVRQAPGRVGLDFVEVSADQCTLFVYFLGKLPPEFASDGPALPAHLRIDGGERIRDIAIVDVDPHISDDPERDDWLSVRVDRAGDHSRYTLQLRDVADADPRYASCTFSFKAGCPSDLDCAPRRDCTPPAEAEPALNYLAKDYASFRRLIQDRLALVAPDWNEAHVPDLGVTLTELLAYTGDYLSYYQDAVASEAYLATARQRISVRRHARLVDYALHEGCNARAWVVAETSAELSLDPAALGFVAGIDADAAVPSVIGPTALPALAGLDCETFAPLLDPGIDQVRWYPAHNRIAFYDWGDDGCQLPRGATHATLVDAWQDGQRALRLRPGDVLMLREVRGGAAGLDADADPTRCWPVRLTRVEPSEDALRPLPATDGATPQPTPLLEVSWDASDALPFALCLSRLGPAPDCARLRGLSVAHGNVLLVDHGDSALDEVLGTVAGIQTQAACLCEGQPGEIAALAQRCEWRLARVPLTHREPAPHAQPASAALRQDPRRALPQLSLHDAAGSAWTPVSDLLDSGPDDPHVVVELDNAGVARLRFGDGELGRAPAVGRRFTARYRIGNGPAGNVGAGAINRVRLRDQELEGISLRVYNPLPASGGRAPESLDDARLYAPSTFRKTLQRAITADDYARLAQDDPRVQRAACELVWTGSWYEADVALDPLGATGATPALLDDVCARLQRVRRIGHDLHVQAATYVAIDLALEVCALPGYERGAVKAALLARFGAGVGSDGRLGLFHPDRLSFGQGLLLSAIVAEAMAEAGVECVRVTRLQRLFLPPNHELENGRLVLAAHEIARLDGDPDRPEHGRLSIVLRGGR
ncbi:hypothetical protein HEP74_04013 [Xanthomonas sp. SS]|uniref:putative baseplate assembly protein n=1 Tax=Xanthomonas sp. SS TaxID=2724122 RepID=UPI00163AD0C8|nr:putative baseplate assembly protein [Xanthomonas sp. SS]QNH18837.1 hypothetical protein HEP74_04013 [Xanthomonas sp. SS]